MAHVDHEGVAGHDGYAESRAALAEFKHIHAVPYLCPDKKATLGSVIGQEAAQLLVEAIAEQVQLAAVDSPDMLDVLLNVALGEPLVYGELRDERGVDILRLLRNDEL